MDDFTKLLMNYFHEIGDLSETDKNDRLNIIYMLGVQNKEVIICRILSSLIEPFGMHGLGIKPIKAFLTAIGINNFSDEELKKSKIIKEEIISNNRRVDIAIHIEKTVIPIEVKINAGDQKSQLFDYYDYYSKNFNCDCIYYLTVNGAKPSEFSVSSSENTQYLSKENIRCISFKKHISDFLDSMKNDAIGAENVLINIIDDFLEVINDMCSDNENLRDIRNAVDKALETSNDTVSFLNILKYHEDVWDEIRFQCLKKSIEENTFYKLVRETNNIAVLNNFDTHYKYTIKKDDDEYAYLFIETNLYLVAEKDRIKKQSKIYDNNDSFSWVHIKYKGKEKQNEKWNLKYIDPQIQEHTRLIDWNLYI